MEVALHGVATKEQLEQLNKVLQGLSAGPVEVVDQHHICLKAPAVDEESSSTEIHLVRSLAEPNVPWCGSLGSACFLAALSLACLRAPRLVRYQGRQMAGEKVEKLGVEVRQVCEAATLAGDAYKVFREFGCSLHYQARRTGFRYRLLLGGQTIVFSVINLERPGAVGQTCSVVPGLWLVEATCRTTRETYVSAADALVMAQQRLADLVTLEKPSHHPLWHGPAQKKI
jgi:hypothetical protein